MIDASVLFEVVTDSPGSERLRARIRGDDDQCAPHLIDAEVLSAVRANHRTGALDATAALQAVGDLALWGGERYPHQPLLERAWELRENIRPYDALYVALAEAFDAPLLTLDARLAGAPGVQCRVEVL